MAAFNTLFASVYAPMDYNYQIWMFGSTVEYLPDRESSQSFQVRCLWKEGAEGETVSPGRYSRLLVATNEIPDLPKRGDAVQRGGRVYDVVDVSSTPTGHSTLLLQENLDGD